MRRALHLHRHLDAPRHRPVQRGRDVPDLQRPGRPPGARPEPRDRGRDRLPAHRVVGLAPHGAGKRTAEHHHRRRNARFRPRQRPLPRPQGHPRGRRSCPGSSSASTRLPTGAGRTTGRHGGKANPAIRAGFLRESALETDHRHHAGGPLPPLPARASTSTAWSRGSVANGRAIWDALQAPLRLRRRALRRGSASTSGIKRDSTAVVAVQRDAGGQAPRRVALLAARRPTSRWT